MSSAILYFTTHKCLLGESASLYLVQKSIFVCHAIWNNWYFTQIHAFKLTSKHIKKTTHQQIRSLKHMTAIKLISLALLKEHENHQHEDLNIPCFFMLKMTFLSCAINLA